MRNMSRVQESPYHIRRLQRANCLRILLNGTAKITLAVQMITVLFVDVGQTLGVIFTALRYTHRYIVQILLEQQAQFTLQIFFVQVVDGFIAGHDIASSKFGKNGGDFFQLR